MTREEVVEVRVRGRLTRRRLELLLLVVKRNAFFVSSLLFVLYLHVWEERWRALAWDAEGCRRYSDLKYFTKAGGRGGGGGGGGWKDGTNGRMK